nr:6642_t:CDS:2 [Entrophospora candida]
MAVLKGRNFEQHIKNALQNHNIGLAKTVNESTSWPQLVKVTSWVPRPNIRHTGDNGIDLLGGFVYEEEKYLLLIQCKVNVRELKGVMGRYPDFTSIGILVVHNDHTISNNMFLEAELAPSNIILTNQVDIYHDLCRFVVFLKEKIILKRSSEKMELKKEMQEEIEKELWAKKLV